ncbi:hypothetical protein, partial [Leucobacter sp. 7(1)]|uniref:hypothetical protein n=1 Tax=Leucobacter sp. 7(1) TaxID=1255613 RepID=UPI001C3E0D74
QAGGGATCGGRRAHPRSRRPRPAAAPPYPRQIIYRVAFSAEFASRYRICLGEDAGAGADGRRGVLSRMLGAGCWMREVESPGLE